MRVLLFVFSFFDLSRHVACEQCPGDLQGGYDPVHNQVIVCCNNARQSADMVQSLAHEMVHMFDNCRKQLDFTNAKHLACSEIRAANLMHCKSRLEAVKEQGQEFWSNSSTRRDCVSRKAALSVSILHKLSLAEASAVVQSVFEPCFGDLEPFGRHFSLFSQHVPRAIFSQKRNYGYY